MQCFQALGIRDRRAQALRDVLGNVGAAQWDAVAKNRFAFIEDADIAAAGPHVDHSNAQVTLFLVQHGQPGCKG